jgi:hypothetical protein
MKIVFTSIIYNMIITIDGERVLSEPWTQVQYSTTSTQKCISAHLPSALLPALHASEALSVFFP